MTYSAPFIVLDTDVASFLINEDPVRAPRYLSHTKGRSLVLPFSCVAELEYGARVRNWGLHRTLRMDSFISRCRIAGAGRNVCAAWADVRVTLKRRGRQIERQDAWVAAVALHLEAPLLTHNLRHYQHVPLLQVISEPD